MTNKVYNAWICKVNNNEVKPVFGDLYIKDNRIKEIRKKNFNAYVKKRNASPKDGYDACGRVITIPLVNFHDHFYSRLAKGLTIKGDMSGFHNILKNLWWKLDRKLDLEMIEASAKLAVIESIKNGVTYIFDHHSSPDFVNGSLNVIADVLRKNNLNGVLCFETTDRNGNKLSAKSINENKNFLKKNIDEQIKGLFGIHASFTVNDKTLKEVSAFVNEYELGIHIHLCEDHVDRIISKEKSGLLPLKRLEKYNLLNDKSILSHSIHLNKNEYETICKYGSAVAINPESNMNNAVGTNNYSNINQSIPLLCGTDGMHSKPGQSLKKIFLLMRNSGLSFDDAFGRIENIYFSQINFVRRFFPGYPTLQTGDNANFILWDYIPPTPLNENNFFGHYLYGVLESQVQSTIQNGKFLMRDKVLQNINEKEAAKEIFKQGERLFKKFNSSKN